MQMYIIVLFLIFFCRKVKRKVAWHRALPLNLLLGRRPILITYALFDHILLDSTKSSQQSRAITNNWSQSTLLCVI